jgi:hypothetical protein
MSGGLNDEAAMGENALCVGAMGGVGSITTAAVSILRISAPEAVARHAGNTDVAATSDTTARPGSHTWVTGGVHAAKIWRSTGPPHISRMSPVATAVRQPDLEFCRWPLA